MTFMTEVDPVVTEGSLLADETSKEEQLKAAAERINNAELTEGELDESMAPEHYEASDLRVLEGLEAVRIRPGMYIGSTGPRGLHHLVYEIVDNSVDEALAGYASHIEITILPDNGIRVVDDGRGIPVDEVPGEGVSGVETVMTKLHAGGKFGGGGYAVSGGLHGVGISVVNALSTRVDIEVRRQGFHWTQTYIDQHPTLEAGRADDRRRVHRYVRDFLGRPEDLRDHHLRLRDAAFPFPADGLPEQGPQDQPDRRA